MQMTPFSARLVGVKLEKTRSPSTLGLANFQAEMKIRHTASQARTCKPGGGYERIIESTKRQSTCSLKGLSISDWQAKCCPPTEPSAGNEKAPTKTILFFRGCFRGALKALDQEKYRRSC